MMTGQYELLKIEMTQWVPGALQAVAPHGGRNFPQIVEEYFPNLTLDEAIGGVSAAGTVAENATVGENEQVKGNKS